eukprot:8864132-Pyramimonas_sp.AAC.1
MSKPPRLPKTAVIALLLFVSMGTRGTPWCLSCWTSLSNSCSFMCIIVSILASDPTLADVGPGEGAREPSRVSSNSNRVVRSAMAVLMGPTVFSRSARETPCFLMAFMSFRIGFSCSLRILRNMSA